MLPSPRSRHGGKPSEDEEEVGADGVSISGDKQMFGRQLWRVVPFIKPYKKRFAVGILANAAARAFDLLPFVAMGLLTDAILNARDSGVDMVFDDYLFYGLLIFGGFVGLALFQGISNYAWETLAQYLQHDLDPVGPFGKPAAHMIADADIPLETAQGPGQPGADFVHLQAGQQGVRPGIDVAVGRFHIDMDKQLMPGLAPRFR